MLCYPRGAPGSVVAPPPPRQSKYADEAAWAHYQATITSLYRDQDKTLAEVMKIMEANHGFFATLKMFKIRIKKWKLDKKHKAPEVREMLRLKAEREAVGKESEFFVRGRKVDWGDVERYMRRSRIPFDSAEAAGAVNELHQRDIICRTPSPLPMARSLQAPDELQRAHETLLIMRGYVDGSIESGQWFLKRTHLHVKPGGFEGFTRIMYWLLLFTDVIVPMQVNDYKGVRLGLGSMLDRLSVLARDQLPSLAQCLRFFKVIVLTLGPADLVKAVSTHVGDMLGVIHGQHHPLPMLWARLESVPQSRWPLDMTFGYASFQINDLQNILSTGHCDGNHPYWHRRQRLFVVVKELRAGILASIPEGSGSPQERLDDFSEALLNLRAPVPGCSCCRCSFAED